MPRLLFDRNTPRRLRHALTGCEVKTAFETGWSRLANGDLIEAAERAGFDVMVTCDQNIGYQQNLEGRRLALVVLDTDRWASIRDQFDRVVEAVGNARLGSYQTETIVASN